MGDYMGKSVYERIKEYKRKYPMTISWRLRQHSKVIDKHLNPDEQVLYAFAAQKGNSVFDIISTYAIVLTNKRIMIARKRFFFGYFFTSITPDLFNDLKVNMGLIWGTIHIDTIKEFVSISHLDRHSLPEIETNITEYMMKEKRKIKSKEK